MNNQIKQILVKAIKEVGPDDHDNGAKEATLEKFAELIIRECANIANAGVDPSEYCLPGNNILEHFGIQE